MEDHQRHHDDDDAHAAWLLRAGILTLTLSSAVALRRAAGGADAAFVIGSYALLLLLLACLRAYERAPPGEAGASRRSRLRRAVWSLSTLLTLMFAWRVAGVMLPSWPAAALLVWALAALTTVGGYVALFHRAPYYY